jgi:hypothetical protein
VPQTLNYWVRKHEVGEGIDTRTVPDTDYFSRHHQRAIAPSFQNADEICQRTLETLPDFLTTSTTSQ